MKRSFRHAAAIATLLLTTACAAGPSGRAPGETGFLLVVHNPLTKVLGSDDALLALGRRACADMNAGLRSDAVVADIGDDPLPGSAAFNANAILTATAARDLCPQHASEFSGSVDGANDGSGVTGL